LLEIVGAAEELARRDRFNSAAQAIRHYERLVRDATDNEIPRRDRELLLRLAQELEESLLHHDREHDHGHDHDRDQHDERDKR
jgi:cell wall assembly regulator SMI1